MTADITLADVRRAAARLDGVAHRTPVLTSRTLDRLVGAHVSLKAESFQRGGAFKFRGAYNAISSLTEEARARGVCTASSGNHAQAVAIACELTGARPVIKALVDDVVTVSDAEIVEAMRFCFERCKLVVEPSGACALAAALAGRVAVEGTRVGIVLSGGNVDAQTFATLLG